MQTALSPRQTLQIRVQQGNELERGQSRFESYFHSRGQELLSRHPAWLRVVRDGFGHESYCVEAVADGETRGLLPLAYVRSRLFGRFLVSLPYVNYGGVIADDESVAARLIDRAVELAEQLDVRYLELRNERATEHATLIHRVGHKVHMRLELPDSSEKLWKGLTSKVRNQIRKAEKCELTVTWGREELLSEFYAVFSHNMRDLGTPVHGRTFFRSVLRQFPERAEFCVVRQGPTPVASALLLHGWHIAEVPSASSLRSHNHTCANMLLYRHLLERAIQSGQSVFDFGRSTPESNTYRFKKQWGAVPRAAEWQYFVRAGSASDMHVGNPRYARFIRIWQKLPIWLTRWIGPIVVRGIP
jgi:FemAB-related protein (PEP-CTERM system-associated)